METTAICVIPLFSGLSERQLEAIMASVKPVHVESGTIVLREGEHGNNMYILVKGAVDVSKRLGLVIAIPDYDDIKEKTLVRLEAPQFFGEMGVLANSERSATVTACTACDLLSLEGADFHRLAEVDPKLGYTVIHNIALVLSARLRSTDQDVVKLTIALNLALGNR